jgi:hypothetical protein
MATKLAQGLFFGCQVIYDAIFWLSGKPRCYLLIVSLAEYEMGSIKLIFNLLL